MSAFGRKPAFDKSIGQQVMVPLAIDRQKLFSAVWTLCEVPSPSFLSLTGL